MNFDKNGENCDKNVTLKTRKLYTHLKNYNEFISTYCLKLFSLLNSIIS
jgi:hypothetical protein